MGEISFNFPPDLQHWIELRLAEGRYADAGDYLRDLIRRDQEGLLPETPQDVAWVRQMIAEAEASGISDERSETIVGNIIAKRRARRG